MCRANVPSWWGPPGVWRRKRKRDEQQACWHSTHTTAKSLHPGLSWAVSTWRDYTLALDADEKHICSVNVFFKKKTLNSPSTYDRTFIQLLQSPVPTFLRVHWTDTSLQSNSMINLSQTLYRVVFSCVAVWLPQQRRSLLILALGVWQTFTENAAET